MHPHPARMIGIAKRLCAATTIVILLLPGELLGQALTSNFVAPGRVEGAGPTMSIGTAASGTVNEVLVHEGSRVRAGQPLVTLDCRPIEAEVRARSAQVSATQAAFDRARNGSRPDEIAVGEAVVGYSQARAEEAQKTLERNEAMREGVSVTAARVLEVQRDARIAAAQLAEARARLALLRAGSREEDVREAEAKHNAAVAELEAARAQLEQCSVRAPVDGVVLDVLANPGQFLSLAVPEPLLHMVQDNLLRVRAEIDLRDLGRVCASQNATVAAEALPSLSIHAQVASISPAVSNRSIAMAGSDARGKDVVAITLDLERGGPTLPIGLPVMVHFVPCTPKT
jgi:multidrug resistance efflux pump